MTKYKFFALPVAVLVFLLVTAELDGLDRSGSAAAGGYTEVVFTDSEDAAKGGQGAQATTESKSFHLANGGLNWPAGADVEYLILDAPAGIGAEQAIETTVATVDGFIKTRNFVRNQSTTQINPCTGQPNYVRWLPGDGPGGVLAFAAACYYTSTKEIVGFRMALDSLDSWATNGDATSFDVQNVATHEMGHVAGIDHVNGPKDGCLTMYKFSSRGEIQKRTLGWGDKRGLDKLYSTGDTTPGTCGS